jgi:hypothetical protein
MIDPNAVTNFERTDRQLQEFLLFCVVAAGKNSKVQAQKLEAFLWDYTGGIDPFDVLQAANEYPENEYLTRDLKRHGMGQYTRIERAFRAIAGAGFDLRTVTAEELETIPGIGPKTARFFILHTQKNAFCAVLDTHILRWMREEKGYTAPKATPTGKLYRRLEDYFLYEAMIAGIEPAALDLAIWQRYSKNGNVEGLR